MRPFPRVLALHDVARELGLSRQYVGRLARAGKLRFQETSAGKIFLASDVTAFKRRRGRQARTDTRIRLKGAARGRRPADDDRLDLRSR